MAQDLTLTTRAEKLAWQQYLDDRKRWVALSTAADTSESPREREVRKKRLLADLELFVQYYLPHYVTDEETGKLIPMGWFHKKASRDIDTDPNFFGVLEWPREHAKSVFADIFKPLHLKAKGELSGMVIVANNKEKAMTLLADIQAELAANARYIADFGEQKTIGDWDAQHFTTQDGVGFWALGRGQSPRGIRKAQRRPNYVVVDDFDDEELVENEDRVQRAVDWLLGGLYGAIAMKKGRFVMVGNRIHQKAALAHVVGDVLPGQAKKEGVYHSKVFALENPKTHHEDQSADGVPAWRENYTVAQIRLKMQRMGYRIAQREYFHRHIRQGTRFRAEWLSFIKVKFEAYPFAVIYNDPSFKDTRKNDFKALMAVAPLGHYRDLLDCWVRQATKLAMVNAHYDMADRLLAAGIPIVYNLIEGGFIQPDFLKDYYDEGVRRGYQLMVKTDNRKKPDKVGRIDDMQPGFELGSYRVNAALRGTTDYQTVEEQLIGFPNAHDDAPDAWEGAIWICNQKAGIASQPPTLGAQRRQNRVL